MKMDSRLRENDKSALDPDFGITVPGLILHSKDFVPHDKFSGFRFTKNLSNYTAPLEIGSICITFKISSQRKLNQS
jgi:hypothetical protein